MPDINLLPPKFKRIDHLDAALPRVKYWLGVPLASMLILLATVVIVQISLKQQSDHLSASITDRQAASEFDKLSTQVRSLASLAEEYQSVFAKNRVWEELFTYLEQTVPADTIIDDVTSSADKVGYAITVTGSAGDRRSIGLFRENLLSYRSQEAQPERVSQVVIESINIDSVTGRQQFSLQISFDLNPKADKS